MSEKYVKGTLRYRIYLYVICYLSAFYFEVQ